MLKLVKKEMIFMEKKQNSTRNINISIEYFNNDNFESIMLVKKIDSNKYYLNH